MNERTQINACEESAALIQNLVSRLPMSCVCIEPIFDECDTIKDLFIVCVNAGFETILGLSQPMLVNRTMSAVFSVLSKESVADILRLIDEAYRSESKTNEAKVRILGRVYRVSLLFLSDSRILTVFEDVHSKYFRKYYYRSIPRDVLTASISRDQLTALRYGITETGAEDHPGEPMDPMAGCDIRPLEIIPDTTDLAEAYDAVFRDPMTGLYNRVFAMEALRMHIDTGVQPLSVVLGDVNGLKTINESLGFHAGDDVLVKIANLLQENCRVDDVVTRWNDGLFMLLLPRASQAVAQQIIKRLQKELNLIFKDVYNIVTFGFSTYDTRPKTAEEMIQEAEAWIY